MIRNNKGSITLEACIVVPVFIILMLLLNGFFIMFMGQQMVCHALIQSTKSLAYDPLATQMGNTISEGGDLYDMLQSIFTDWDEDSEFVSHEEWYKEENAAELPEIIKDRFLIYLKSQNQEEMLDVLGVKDGELDFSGSTCKDGVLTVNLKYTQEFIFNAAGLGDIERELQLKINLFQYE